MPQADYDFKEVGQNFYFKINRLHTLLTTHPSYKDWAAIVVQMGILNTDQESIGSTFQQWLTQAEMPDTAISVSRWGLFVMTSISKKAYLEKMEVPEGYEGPELNVIVKEKIDRQDANFGNKLAAQALNLGIEFFNSIQPPDKVAKYPKLGVLTRDLPVEGAFMKNFERHKQKEGVSLVDCNSLFLLASSAKNEQDRKNIRISGLWTMHCFENLARYIILMMDQGKSETHKRIAQRVRFKVESDEKVNAFQIRNSLKDVDTECLGMAHDFLIHSGQNFTHQINVKNTDDILSPTLITLQTFGVYMEMRSAVCRTFMINPTQRQRDAYDFLVGIGDLIKEKLRPRKSLSEVYFQVKNQAQRQFSGFRQFPATLGGGVGIKTFESCLEITGNNNALVEEGMTFHTRITLKDFDPKYKGLDRSKNFMMIGDTLLVDKDKTIELTDASSKQPSKVIFEYEDQEELSENEEAAGQEGNLRIKEIDDLTTGTRSAKLMRQTEEQRRKTQETLFQAQYRKLEEAYKNGGIQMGDNSNSNSLNLASLKGYQHRDFFPPHMKKGECAFDRQKKTVLFPLTIFGQQTWLPIHVFTIRNVSLTEERKNEFCLRVNLHTPLQTHKDLILPCLEGHKQVLFIKELTLRGSGNLTAIDRMIKDCLRETRNNILLQQKNPFMSLESDSLGKIAIVKCPKDLQRVQLDNVTLRPIVQGKKAIGLLTTEINGFCFRSSKGLEVSFAYENIRYSFFHPCNDDFVVIVHFTLKAPIMIAGKKIMDVAFYREVGNQFDDLMQSRGVRKQMSDADEMEQERREKLHRVKQNKRFLDFCKKASEFAEKNGNVKFEFEVPYMNLKFVGCHHKSSVNIYPTARSLISIVDLPTFVLDISHIEIVHFERVQLSLKNFDMAIVFKDYVTYKRINSIPLENLDTIKNWLNSVGIVFSEGPRPLNWITILEQIRMDQAAFIRDGGWSFLHGETGIADDPHGDDTEDSDSNFDEEDIAKANTDSDESEYSGNESYGDSNSDGSEKSELSDEGTTYEEMEEIERRKQREKMNSIRSMKGPMPVRGKAMPVHRPRDGPSPQAAVGLKRSHFRR